MRLRVRSSGGRLNTRGPLFGAEEQRTRTHGLANEAARQLRTVKLLHTAVWAVFAGCVVAIPWLSWQRRFSVAAVLATILKACWAVYGKDRSAGLDDGGAGFDFAVPVAKGWVGTCPIVSAAQHRQCPSVGLAG